MLQRNIFAFRVADTPFGVHSLPRRPLALLFEHCRLYGGVMVSAPKRSRFISISSSAWSGEDPYDACRIRVATPASACGLEAPLHTDDTF